MGTRKTEVWGSYFSISLKSIIAYVVILMYQPSFSQPEIAWEAAFGGSDDEFLHDGQATSDGGYIMAGHTLSNDGDVSGNHGEEDVWIVKVDMNGAMEWQHTYGGSGREYCRAIIQTGDGGYIFVGSTGSEDGDVSGTNGSIDFWTVKLDSNGNIEWENTYGGNSNDHGRSITSTSDGGYLIGGYTSSNDGDVTTSYGGSDIWIVKIDPVGVLEWEQSFGGSDSEFLYDVKQTSDNGYLIIGDTESNDGVVTVNQGWKDVWIIKTDATGTLEWQKTFGGTEWEVGYDSLLTADGGYLVLATTLSDDGDVSNSNGIYDLWLLKLDATGSLEWEHCFGGSGNEGGHSILSADDGGYVLAGFSSSTNGDVSNNNGNYDGWIIKITPDGEIEWEKSYGGSNSDTIEAIRYALDGNLVGFAESFSSDGDVSSNQGGRDYWIMKFGEILSNSAVEVSQTRIYPNPASSVIHIEANIPIEQLQLFNLLGQTVQQVTGASQLTVDSLPNGTYVLKITFEDGATVTKKVLVQ